MTSFLALADSGPITGPDWLLLTTQNETSPAKMTYTSEVLEPSGTGTVPHLPADTVIESFGAFTTEIDGNVLEITGITDTDGAFGGASLDLL